MRLTLILYLLFVEGERGYLVEKCVCVWNVSELPAPLLIGPL